MKQSYTPLYNHCMTTSGLRAHGISVYLLEQFVLASGVC